MPRVPKKERGITQYKLKNGELRYKFVIYQVRARKSRPFWFKGFTTKTAAKEKRKELLAEKAKLGAAFRPEKHQRRESSRSYEDQSLGFKSFAEQWYKWKCRQTKKGRPFSNSYLTVCRSALDKHLIPYYQRNPMLSVDRPSWVKLVEQMSESSVGYSIQRQVTTCLSEILTRAANLGHIPMNPLNKVWSVLGPAPDADRYPMTNEQRQRFLPSAQTFRNGRFNALLYGLFNGGPRPGEQLAIEIEDFDPVNRRVRLQWNYTDGELKELPKDGEVRYIYLSVETTRLYLIQRDIAIREQTEAGFPPRWLFFNPNARGPYKLYNNHQLREIVAAVCRKAGIPHFVPYEGRTTTACALKAKGVSVEEIGEHLGHSGTQSTKRYLKHASVIPPDIPPDQPRLIDRLDLPLHEDDTPDAA